MIVLDARQSGSRETKAFARLLVSLTPDLIRVVERSLAQRQRNVARPSAPIPRTDTRAYRGGVQLSEIEYDTRLPFLRKVTVRKASVWTNDLPFVDLTEPPTANRDGKLRTAGLLSVGGALALAAAGVLANRLGAISRLGSRRGY